MKTSDLCYVFKFGMRNLETFFYIFTVCQLKGYVSDFSLSFNHIRTTEIRLMIMLLELKTYYSRKFWTKYARGKHHAIFCFLISEVCDRTYSSSSVPTALCAVSSQLLASAFASCCNFFIHLRFTITVLLHTLYICYVFLFLRDTPGAIDNTVAI
jgi:hypothetical protein